MMKFFENKPQAIFVIILLVGIALRFYHGFDWFEFAHDGDLYSWVIKDILVDGHLRLIGQLTSTPGIFIGSLFYYSLVPFYYFGQMSPLSLVYYYILLSILVLVSYFFVFKQLFDERVALIVCFLQAVMVSRVMYDRWVVPTILSSIWEVWFLYAVVLLVRKKYYSLPILGVLLGLVWQINFGLLPAFLAAAVALLFTKKIPPVKWMISGVLCFTLVSVPLFIFESRHNFQQFNALFSALGIDQGGGQGLAKLNEVFMKVSGNIWQLFFYPGRGSYPLNFWFLVSIIVWGVVLPKKKYLEYKVLIVLLSWVVGVVLFFGINSKLVSEYYFQSISIVFMTIVAIGLSSLFDQSYFWKRATYLILGFIGIYSVWVLVSVYNYNHLGYVERHQVAEYIKQNSTAKGYPCVAISYITTPGNNFGFRYVFYMEKLKTKPVSSGVPVYTIGIPEEKIPMLPSTKRFGAIRVNEPDNLFKMNELEDKCAGANWNIEEDLFGFDK